MSVGNCKEIKDFPNYYVTKDGHIWSGWRDQYVSETLMENGYRRVVLSKNNKSHNFLVHRLVAEAFIPNPENKPCVNHKDFKSFIVNILFYKIAQCCDFFFSGFHSAI